MKKILSTLAVVLVAGLVHAQQMDYCIGKHPDKNLIPKDVTFKAVHADSIDVAGSGSGASGTSSVTTGLTAQTASVAGTVTPLTASFLSSLTLQTATVQGTNGTFVCITGIVQNAASAMTNATVTTAGVCTNVAKQNSSMVVVGGSVTTKP